MTENSPAVDDHGIVDDFFWLSQAAALIRAGGSLRLEAARQLMSALSWLWTVYTGTTIAGAIIGDQALSVPSALIFSLPSLLIVAAYAAAVFAYMPVTVNFDPRDPDEVREVYVKAVLRGRHRLSVALGVAGAAAVSLSVAIGIAVTSV